jgi:hypothetical protein
MDIVSELHTQILENSIDTVYEIIFKILNIRLIFKSSLRGVKYENKKSFAFVT